MTKRITIDPITRIEGHLRVDIEVNNGSVSEAWVSCTMWRGLERILQGRDPREAWLFAQRICGVCTTVHAIASVRAVEDALQLQIPANAQHIRNLILINHALRDHVVHFYQLSLVDWVDVLEVAKGDPVRASALGERSSSWTRNSSVEMKAARDRMARVLESGELGIFSEGYWGHPQMRMPPDGNLLLFSHYMQSFEFQRKAAQVVAMLGGKTPHIQNLAVGGVANAINLDSVAVLGIERLAAMRALMHEFSEFVQNVYFADACVLASAYPDWFDIGRGTDEYLAVPDLAKDSRTGRFDLPGGYWRGPLHVSEDQVSAFSKSSFIDAVSEDISHAYYRGDKSQHPWKGNTTPAYTDWQPENKYTWVKAARYEGRPAEVGPLAQVLIGYKQGHALTRKWTDAALERVSAGAGRRIGVDQLRSTMGRHLARAIRAAMLTELAEEYWQLFAENVASGDTTVQTPFDIPNNEVRGVGIHEAPRGALSHWVVIDKGRIANYQAMVPSTWNAGPRDDKGQRSPYEAALLGTPVADAERPLETIRTIHSFDPCMACACHTFDLSGKKLGEVKAL